MSTPERNPKRQRLSPSTSSTSYSAAEEIPILPNTSTSTSTPAPDSFINHTKALAYWSSTEATVNGVLGGYPQVSRADLQGSANFLAKLRRQSKHARLNDAKEPLKRVVDCGAGIGRVTDGFLSRVAETVDVVEPVKGFTDQVTAANVGRVYNVGLEAWFPEKEEERTRDRYDVVWVQWCIGQLTDVQLVGFLKRIQGVVVEGGWIVVKENLSNHHLGEDIYDETDSSVTRTDDKFRKLFEEAELKVVANELQKGLPKGLYPVKSYALQPR